MGFNIFGIGKNNSSVNHTDDKKGEKHFGIRKGDKIGPLNKDTISFSALSPEENLEQTIKSLAENCRGSKEVFSSTLKKIATRGTEKNPELLAKRIEILKRCDKEDAELLIRIMFLEFDGKTDTSFLLDNLEEIKKIIKEKQISSENIYTGPEEVLGAITPENYSTFLECAKNEELMGDDFATLVMYKAKPHRIEYGNETVKVDSMEVLSLISGRQSITTVRENSYDKFEATVNSLIPKDYEKDNQQYYYKIAEGILSQKPELAQIAIDYDKYSELYQGRNLTKEQYSSAMEQFFVEQEQNGTLPKEIELKTIYPDENALISPALTLQLFLQGKTASQEKKE